MSYDIVMAGRPEMLLEEVPRRLEAGGLVLKDKRRNGNNTGIQLPIPSRRPMSRANLTMSARSAIRRRLV
jgi:hypothetical protein